MTNRSLKTGAKLSQQSFDIRLFSVYPRHTKSTYETGNAAA